MNFDTIPDDLITYIIMFWFVAMPVGLVALGWWCYFNALAIRKHKQIADNNTAEMVGGLLRYREALEKHNEGVIRIIQSHTAAIAALEDSPKSKPPKYRDGTVDYDNLINNLRKERQKSLKDKVLAASKRKRK